MGLCDAHRDPRALILTPHTHNDQHRAAPTVRVVPSSDSPARRSSALELRPSVASAAEAGARERRRRRRVCPLPSIRASLAEVVARDDADRRAAGAWVDDDQVS